MHRHRNRHGYLMIQPWTAENAPSDRGQLPRIDDRPPIWATVTTIALFVAGFRPRRLSPVPFDHMGAPDEGRGRLASALGDFGARMEGHSAPGFSQHLRTPDHCSGRRRDVLHSAGHISCHRGPGRDLWAVLGPRNAHRSSGEAVGPAARRRDRCHPGRPGSHPSVAARSG